MHRLLMHFYTYLVKFSWIIFDHLDLEQLLEQGLLGLVRTDLRPLYYKT